MRLMMLTDDIFDPVLLSTEARCNLKQVKVSELEFIEYNVVHLEKSSIKVTKYRESPREGVSIGLLTSDWKIQVV